MGTSQRGTSQSRVGAEGLLETQSGEAEPVSVFGCAQTQMASFLCGYSAQAGLVHAFLPAERSGGARG